MAAYEKNKLALFGIGIIFLATLVALSGPLVRPDSTPKANDQILEVTTKKPGFTVDLLRIKKNEKASDVSFWKKLTYGSESDFKTIPIYDYSFDGSNIIIEKYTGNEINNGQIQKYNLADVVYAIDHNKVSEHDGILEFYTLEEGKKKCQSLNCVRW